MQLWLSDTESYTIPESPSPVTGEIASRRRSLDYWGLSSYLPDPDPVLQKLGQDVLVYRDLLADPHVFACYQSRKGGVLSADWTIEPELGRKKNPDPKLIKLLGIFQEQVDLYGVISQILDASFFGFSVLEVLWSYHGGVLAAA